MEEEFIAYYPYDPELNYATRTVLVTININYFLLLKVWEHNYKVCSSKVRLLLLYPKCLVISVTSAWFVLYMIPFPLLTYTYLVEILSMEG